MPPDAVNPVIAANNARDAGNDIGSKISNFIEGSINSASSAISSPAEVKRSGVIVEVFAR